MKYVPLRKEANLNAHDLFVMALENAPVGSNGIVASVILKRAAVLSKLEAAKDAGGVELEDDHWSVLVQAIDGVGFTKMSHAAMKDFAVIHDDLVKAKEPEKN